MSRALNPLSLQVYVAVVEQESFTAAGTRLGLSQPAVSFHIRALEERFGIPLLERIGRKVIPTVAGAELLIHAMRITTSFSAVDQAMARFVEELGGTLRIGTGTTFCMAVLPAVIRQLRETHPALRLEVTTATTTTIVQGLEDDRFDVGIVTIPVRGRGLQVSPLLDDEVVLLAPAAMNLRSALTPEVVAELQPMAFEPLGMTRSLIDGWFAAAGRSFQPTVSLGSVEAIRELVATGLGPALLSRLALGPAATAPGTKSHRLSPPLRRSLAIATRNDRAPGTSLDAFVETVQHMSPPAGGTER